MLAVLRSSFLVVIPPVGNELLIDTSILADERHSIQVCHLGILFVALSWLCLQVTIKHVDRIRFAAIFVISAFLFVYPSALKVMEDSNT